MKQYDAIIVGGSSTGSYFARQLGKQGFSVLVVEASSEDKVGTNYNIFHMNKTDFTRFNLPLPKENEDKAYEFTGSDALSAYDHYPKPHELTMIGMHKHAWLMRLIGEAKKAGVKYQFASPLTDLILKDNRVIGIKCKDKKGEKEYYGKLIADCSGIPSVARVKLPENYGVENFEISDTEQFYVTLRYAKYKHEKDYVKRQRTWPFYKTWEAPSADPTGAILGVGATLNFEKGERIYGEFEKAVKLPEYEVEYLERGTTPYRRPPYSFVSDSFIAMGDCACLTKPHLGEGVTSSMVQVDIAADVIGKLLKEKKDLSRENLWPINKFYVEEQGKTFAGMLATLIGATTSTAKENEFFFKEDIIFSKASFAAMAKDQNITFSTSEMIGVAMKMVKGVVTGKLSIKTINILLKAMKNSEAITLHYDQFPSTPEGFEAWCATADKLWQACGKMT